MKLKFIINDRDKIKGFVWSIQMLSRHTDRLIFIAKENAMTVLVEKPTMWIDIDVFRLFQSYVFDGTITDNQVEDFIYFDIIAKQLLFPLEALLTSEVDYTEISIVKNNIAPFLKVYAKPVSEDYSAVFDSQIPMIIIPQKHWRTVKIPRDLPYDGYCRTPRYPIFRNYIDIYRIFKILKFRIQHNGLALQGGSELSSQVSTYFEDVITRDESGKRAEKTVCAIVDSRRLSGIFHSINILNLTKPRIVCRVKHSRYLLIDFSNGDDTIHYKFVMENLEEVVDDENDEMFEKYRRDGNLF
ncbi:uncharacterized protein [Chironomus tepperi]|uniref:uncharacterized protein n=1 Tax=Chironomus tepperi TaxID=113505 RepID=UPI00391F9038